MYALVKGPDFDVKKENIPVQTACQQGLHVIATGDGLVFLHRGIELSARCTADCRTMHTALVYGRTHLPVAATK